MQEKYTTYTLFREVTKLDFSRMFPLLKAYHIHPGQMPVLHILSERESMSQGELAKILRITPATMTISLNRMEANGLIAKSTDAADKRRIVISLTNKGRKLSKELAKTIRELELSFTKGFSDEENQAFSEYLLRVRDNLLQEPRSQNHSSLEPTDFQKIKNEEGTCLV